MEKPKSESKLDARTLISEWSHNRKFSRRVFEMVQTWLSLRNKKCEEENMMMN